MDVKTRPEVGEMAGSSYTWVRFLTPKGRFLGRRLQLGQEEGSTRQLFFLNLRFCDASGFYVGASALRGQERWGNVEMMHPWTEAIRQELAD